ncbi:hypothetical protein [Staphylococcus aureus]|uniref:hypothetical protein n=1 Tax=Staphylococcus aureus TaxID=1280 RepID=UPI0015E72C5D|nr:hypothetical protein [Staphylococcus aureus]
MNILNGNENTILISQVLLFIGWCGILWLLLNITNEINTNKGKMKFYIFIYIPLALIGTVIVYLLPIMVIGKLLPSLDLL